MKYIDRKVTTWERIYFNDSVDLEEIKNEISKDINYFFYNHPDFMSSGFIYDTMDNIEPDKSNATVELYEDQMLIWDNSVKK